jgi:formylglycine-generating enzyme
MRALIALVGCAGFCAVAVAAEPAPSYRLVKGGSMPSLLPPDGKLAPMVLPSYSMRALPVTQQEFSRFVERAPQWSKAQLASSTMADAQYLKQGFDDRRLYQGSNSPATQVSWFAAQAYCASEQAQLPSWHQWEYAAAADEKRRDARQDPRWRARILDWYGQTSKPLAAVGSQPKNVYGIADLHGLIWEWVDDASALMVSGDNRTQGDPNTLQFCGAGALSVNDRENYPVVMRIAMLSSLSAASTNRNLGFRCVRELPRSKK